MKLRGRAVLVTLAAAAFLAGCANAESAGLSARNEVVMSETPAAPVATNPLDSDPSAEAPGPSDTENPSGERQASGERQDWGADSPQAFAQQLFETANQARIDAGVLPLAFSECAAQFAEPRAAALIGHPLTHATLAEVGGSCPLASGMSGENLVRGEGTAEELVEAWLNSPSHRANLLNPDYTDSAIGCVQDPDEDGAPRWLCSQLFIG